MARKPTTPQPVRTVRGDPRALRVVETLRDGTRATIRAVSATDRERLVRAFANLERETIYRRFFAFKDALSAEELAFIASVDFVRDVILVATIGENGEETIIGAGSYSACTARDGRPVAEVAFVVEEDYQGLGIARRLLAQLTRIARTNGVARLEADVMAGNGAMLRVFEGAGLPMQRQFDHGTIHVSMDLAHPASGDDPPPMRDPASRA